MSENEVYFERLDAGADGKLALQHRLNDEEIQISAQRRHLRSLIQSKIFYTLWGQLAFLFILLLLQGFKLWGFALNDWSFGILVNGAIIQTFFIVRFIVVHLFPTTSQK